MLFSSKDKKVYAFRLALRVIWDEILNKEKAHASFCSQLGGRNSIINLLIKHHLKLSILADKHLLQNLQQEEATSDVKLFVAYPLIRYK